jgi:hypothetical protein
MIFDLNCKPFSPAHTGRKNVSKCISCYTVQFPIQKFYCYNPAESNPVKALLNHVQTTTKKY